MEEGVEGVEVCFEVQHSYIAIIQYVGLHTEGKRDMCSLNNVRCSTIMLWFVKSI